MLSLLATTAFSLSLMGSAEAAPIGSTTISPVTVEGQSQDENKLICKSAPQMGTRLGAKKICHTKSEWALMNAEARRALDENGRRTMGDNK